MKSRQPPFTPVETQAARWLAKRDTGFSAADEAAFVEWCKADPSHEQAVAEIEAVWTVFNQPATTGQTDLLQGELQALVRRDRRRWIFSGTAAMLTAACVALFFIAPRSAAPPATLTPGTNTARISEPRQLTLPDGSLVELKPGAEVVEAFDPAPTGLRRVVLRNGAAHFSVTKNPQRPFVVEAAGIQIRAVGTAFAVQVGETAVEVLVTEGRVAVNQSPGKPNPLQPAGTASPLAMLDAGKYLVVGIASHAATAPAMSVPVRELAERLAWRVPRLDLTESSVDEAIRLFNHHHGTPILLADESVAALRVTGMFRADNVEGFVRALETSLGVRSEHQADGTILLRRAR